MSTTKKIVMNHKNSQGLWEILYPRTVAEQVITNANQRFVSDAQIEAWNAKASTDVATAEANGLLSAQDKAKLDGIAAGANNYVLPQATADILGGIKAGTNVSIVDGALNIADGTTSAKGVVQLNSDVTSESEATAATSAAVKAVNDKVVNHAADEEVHITAAERSNWNAKASTAVATQTANGLLSSDDKVIIDGLASRFTAAQTSAEAYTDAAIDSLVDGAPEAYNTLKEISDYIGEHQDEYNALLALSGGKVSQADFDAALVTLNDAIEAKGDSSTINSHTVSEEEPTNLLNGAIWFQEVS